MRVTCLCLTRNRREWLPKAIACYQAQTHADRELLIVADSPEDFGDLPDDRTIRLIVAPSAFTERRRQAKLRMRARHR
jgi:hypothetical protein